MSKLNIFKPGWIDMVFEGRNKKYGAYQLRSENPKTTVKALILGAVLFSFVVALPKIYEMVEGLATNKEAEEQDKIIEVIDLPPPPEEVIELPPPPPPVEQQQAPKSIVEEVKFKPLEAAKKEEVPEDPPLQKQFKEADPSSRNAEAAPTGDVVIGKPAGDLDKGVEAPDNTIYNTAVLQVQPDFPGGIDAFRSFVSRNFRVPEVDQDMTVRIYVQFVVEKDGTLTDVKAVRDPGYGLAKEAERVVRSNKVKWSPGIQNGKPVRTRFSLPITLQVKA
jgi:protein TonB